MKLYNNFISVWRRNSQERKLYIPAAAGRKKLDKRKGENRVPLRLQESRCVSSKGWEAAAWWGRTETSKKKGDTRENRQDVFTFLFSIWSKRDRKSKKQKLPFWSWNTPKADAACRKLGGRLHEWGWGGRLLEISTYLYKIFLSSPWQGFEHLPQPKRGLYFTH